MVMPQATTSEQEKCVLSRWVPSLSVGSVNLGFIEKIGLKRGDFYFWVQKKMKKEVNRAGR